MPIQIYGYDNIFKVGFPLFFMQKEVKLFECGCERCGHKWFTRHTKVPKACPECNSPYWNKPRKPKKPKTPVRAPIKPVRSTPRPVRGRGGIFSTAARRDVPVRRPTQREIDRAGIGGAT